MQKQIHILIVDDDALMLRLFGDLVADMGYEALYAHNGDEGREMARRLQPDLILLDWRMPVMDGLKAAEELKGEDITKHIPIILLTNADVSADAEKNIRELGIDAYLHKGSPINVVRDKINELLANKKPPRDS